MSDELEPSDEGVEKSVAELIEQFGRDSGRLAVQEAALSASRHAPELRRLALGGVAMGIVVLAAITAFALLNWAAVSGLSSALPTWLSALVVAGGWLVVAAALLVVLLRSGSHLPGLTWWRMIGSDGPEAVQELQASRDQAEQAVRDTIDLLAAAVARAAVGQLMDAMEPLGEAAADVGEELLEASEDIVEAIEEQLPGGGAVGQVIDIVLFPGRLGLRIATAVLRGSSNEASRDTT